MACRSAVAEARFALPMTALTMGKRMAARTMMMPMTTSISTSVNARRCRRCDTRDPFPPSGRLVAAEVGDVIAGPVDAVDAGADQHEPVFLLGGNNGLLGVIAEGGVGGVRHLGAHRRAGHDGLEPVLAGYRPADVFSGLDLLAHADRRRGGVTHRAAGVSE